MGNPVCLHLGPGQEADISHAPAILKKIFPKALIADKAYDSNDFMNGLKAVQPDMILVIPSKRNRRQMRDWDRELYKERNKTERFFNRLKHYRRIATRYDKTARNYLAFILLASSVTLLL